MTPAELAQLDGELTAWRDSRAASSLASAAEWRAVERDFMRHAEELPMHRRSQLAGAAVAARKAEWHLRRANVKPFGERAAACGAVAVQLTCKCCGVVDTVERRCGARLACQGCSKKFYGRMRRRMLGALAARLADEQARWKAAGSHRGRQPRPALLTLTLRHSGDLAKDRRALSAAWHRFASWWRMREGRALPYAWSVEVTPGSDGLGHVHMHAVCIIPWVDYGQLHAAWKRATLGHATHIDVQTGAKGRPNAAVTTAQAARYLAKYATKGCDPLPPELRAAWVVAQHGKRAVSTCRGWWVRDSSACVWRGRHTEPLTPAPECGAIATPWHQRPPPLQTPTASLTSSWMPAVASRSC